jgi:hypothetical protein
VAVDIVHGIEGIGLGQGLDPVLAAGAQDTTN